MKFEQLLEESLKFHGHLCPGQVLGVRMSMLGLRLAGIDEPWGKDRKNIIVFVEMDRCATDAVQSVTGCSLGHRTMKFFDYGKMAATFVNLKTGKAMRVLAKEESRDKAKELFPDIENKYKAQLEAYKVMSDEELFDTMDVKIVIPPEDMPGRPLRRLKCDMCHEYIQDSREIVTTQGTLCKACAEGSYYRLSLGESAFFNAPVMQKSHNELKVKSKLWIEIEGEPVFGRGRRYLLKAIDKYGSINQAAKEINVSYKKAWSYINAMEERLGIRLIERQSGGKGGGGALLTKEGREFLKKYEKLEEGINEIVNKKFKGIFY